MPFDIQGSLTCVCSKFPSIEDNVLSVFPY